MQSGPRPERGDRTAGGMVFVPRTTRRSENGGGEDTVFVYEQGGHCIGRGGEGEEGEIGLVAVEELEDMVCLGFGAG
jgi:hypothetical protein